MTERVLKLVEPGVYDLGRKPESLRERVRRIQMEAQVLAVEEVEELRRTLAHAVEQAEAIASGGDVFPVGVREQARRLAAELPPLSQNLQALSERHLRSVIGGPVPPVWEG